MGLERRKKEDLSEKISKNIGWKEAVDSINQKGTKKETDIDMTGPLQEPENNSMVKRDKKETNTNHST